MADSGAGSGLHHRDQHTGYALEDVPLDSEAMADGHQPLLPSTGADEGYTVHDRAQQMRDFAEVRRLRIEKYWSGFSIALLHICEKLPFIPRSWLQITTEEGTDVPEAVRWIRFYYRKYCTVSVMAIVAAFTVLWLLQWLVGAPSAVMPDGTHLDNVYNPSSPSHVSLGDPNFAKWLTQHRARAPEMNRESVRKRFVAAPVYHAGEMRNISLDWLRDVLENSCPKGKCDCMHAVEIGVLANAVALNNKMWLDPVITDASNERVEVKIVEDGARISAPVLVIVEYTCLDDGYRDKMTLDREQAFCMTRAQGLFTGKPV